MYSDRIQIIQHKGKKIFSFDYSDLTHEQMAEMMEELKIIIKKEPPNSLLTLVNTENFRFSTATLNLFNKFAKEIEPYDKASAILGVKGLIKFMYDGYAKINSKLELKTFEDKNEALDWLASR